MVRSSFCLGLVLAATALFACGGSQPAPATPGGETPAPSAEAPSGEAPAGGAEMVWKDDMSTKDKAAFMKAKVSPEMGKVFQAHDSAKYANFSCKTCHGKDMKPKPVDALPELHMKDGKLLENDKMPEMVKFMHEDVVPKMAELFGKPPYDPKTNSGFGCGGCHKMNM
jgi:cytochrome c553